MKLFPNFTRHHLITHTNFVLFLNGRDSLSKLNGHQHDFTLHDKTLLVFYFDRGVSFYVENVCRNFFHAGELFFADHEKKNLRTSQKLVPQKFSAHGS